MRIDPHKVSLRPATARDSRFAYDLKKAALGEYVERTCGWDENVQRKLHQRRFRPSETQIIVCENRDIGLIATHRAPDHIHLRQLFLLPAAQNNGVGSYLMRQILRGADQKALPVRLQVLKTNSRAKAFYERLGLAPVGETDTHYQMESLS